LCFGRSDTPPIITPLLYCLDRLLLQPSEPSPKKKSTLVLESSSSKLSSLPLPPRRRCGEIIPPVRGSLASSRAGIIIRASIRRRGRLNAHRNAAPCGGGINLLRFGVVSIPHPRRFPPALPSPPSQQYPNSLLASLEEQGRLRGRRGRRVCTGERGGDITAARRRRTFSRLRTIPVAACLSSWKFRLRSLGWDHCRRYQWGRAGLHRPSSVNSFTGPPLRDLRRFLWAEGGEGNS
jgi:hypothetical protein